MGYQISITPTALKMLQGIQDRRIRQKIVDTIDKLSEEPQKQGKPLGAELADYRSLRTVGQRYRIIYRVDGEQVIVYVVAVGIRKEGDKADIYTLAKKLIKVGLLESPVEPSQEKPEEKPEGESELEPSEKKKEEP